jgi:hypothetical protein
MNDAEAVLANALVIMIGGNMPPVSPEQVCHHSKIFYDIEEVDMQVKRYSCTDFLVVFSSKQLVDAVLHAPPPQRADLLLTFHSWNRQAGALFKLFLFKVLLSISHVPAHAWLVETIQAIEGSSYLVFEVFPRLLDQSDLSSF